MRALQRDILEEVGKAGLPLFQKLRLELCYWAAVNIEVRQDKWGKLRSTAGDLQKIDLGGSGGMDPVAWGNVFTRFSRRCSNSEYLVRSEQ